MLKSRKTAALVTAFLIVFSVFALGGNALKRQNGDLDIVYENGMAGVYTVPAEEVQNLWGQAVNMHTVLQKYHTVPQKELDSLANTSDKLLSAKKTDEKVRLANQLYNEMDGLFQSRGDYGLSEQDGIYMSSIMAEADSIAWFLIDSGYNDVAEMFLVDAKKFPANIICGVRGIKTEFFEFAVK